MNTVYSYYINNYHILMCNVYNSQLSRVHFLISKYIWIQILNLNNYNNNSLQYDARVQYAKFRFNLGLGLIYRMPRKLCPFLCIQYIMEMTKTSWSCNRTSPINRIATTDKSSSLKTGSTVLGCPETRISNQNIRTPIRNYIRPKIDKAVQIQPNPKGANPY